MKVSVVIPTYNRAYIILEALESVLDQTYCDFEIIVVDDGSTDNTAQLLQGRGNGRLRYIKHERNRGCSAAYNSGIAATNGDVICFLDSDDKWKPDYLQQHVDFLSRHPEVDVSFTDTEIFSSTKHTPSLVALMQVFPGLLGPDPKAIETVLSGRQMFLCLLEEVPIKPSALAVRRELFGKAGTFDEAWPSGTDWELFLRFTRFASFGFINQPLIVQRQTPDSTFLKFMEKDKELLLKVALREKARMRNDPEAVLAVNRGISDHCNNLAWLYLHSGKTKKSVRVYFVGFRETGEFAMLMRAASIMLPSRFREVLKRLVRRARIIEVKTPTQL